MCIYIYIYIINMLQTKKAKREKSLHQPIRSVVEVIYDL